MIFFMCLPIYFIKYEIERKRMSLLGSLTWEVHSDLSSPCIRVSYNALSIGEAMVYDDGEVGRRKKWCLGWINLCVETIIDRLLIVNNRNIHTAAALDTIIAATTVAVVTTTTTATTTTTTTSYYYYYYYYYRNDIFLKGNELNDDPL